MICELLPGSDGGEPGKQLSRIVSLVLLEDLNPVLLRAQKKSHSRQKKARIFSFWMAGDLIDGTFVQGNGREWAFGGCCWAGEGAAREGRAKAKRWEAERAGKAKLY
jgi:hypothetical protein